MATKNPSLKRMDYYDKNTKAFTMRKKDFGRIYDQLSNTNRRGRQNLARGDERYNRVLQLMKNYDRNGQPLNGGTSNSPITLLKLV